MLNIAEGQKKFLAAQGKEALALNSVIKALVAYSGNWPNLKHIIYFSFSPNYFSVLSGSYAKVF